ncbi:hypothetical protein BRADI_1g01487v3 [Brachypodium distachyon]|uniref:Uncharacterized protein n=1 Tax=Brachypodium distachyon TaxID=15368 RepID=A0A0Q3GLX3_BRADI|nr:hypothetical protein BRADI_1g01487v3 [Brachypodium distachyon]
MAGDTPAPKRPKLEKEDYESAYWPRPSPANGSAPKPPANEAPPAKADDMPEEAALAIIAHHERDIEHCKLKLIQYQSMLDKAESKLADAQSRLALYKDRARDGKAPAPPDRRTPPPLGQRESKRKIPAQDTAAARPQLVIPGPNSRQALRPAPRPDPLPGPKKAAAAPTPSSSSTPPDRQRTEEKKNKPKRKTEEKEHQNLIQSVKKLSATVLRFHGGTLVSSQHKRKLRCLELCPANDQLVVTSALDGIVTLWQVQSKGPSISLLSTTNCFSPKQRWPEDVAWHPDGDTIFAVYSADGGDSQVSMMNLNISGQKVTFLPAKPHTKGIINNINFMPWSDAGFMTAGSDHSVILWQEKDDSWSHKKVHKELHSSAVMGVAGLQQRKTIISVGADKRIISFDLSAERAEYKNLIDSKCMSVLLNPCDFNLYMVQTASPGRQLRLFDIRLRQTEVHALGWKQESSESQSALINQAWSPNGWYLSSGSADPVIHIFDIRYQGENPCQSVQAHQKRVFKAVWHQTFPVLTSISSDLNVAIHKYS